MLRYTTYGNPLSPCLVFVHGYALHSGVWKDVLPLLADHFYSVAIDLPASKELPQVQDVESAIVNGIFALIQKEHLSTFGLVGHSMGGYLSLAFAERYPHLIRGLSLVNSTCFADSPTRKEARQQIISHIETYGSHSFLLQAIPSWFGAPFKEKNYATVMDMIRSADAIHADSLILYQRYMMERKDRSSLLSQPTIPTQIIVGELDHLISADDFDTLHLPHGHTVSIPEVAHMSMLENPQAVAGYIRSFFLPIS